MKRILAIDDDNGCLAIIEKLLTRLIPECSVDTAKSGLEGLAKMEDYMPDAVLLDAFMPGMDGFQVVERIKQDEQFKHIPVIMISGSFGDMEYLEASRVGADDYLPKPFMPQELAERLKVMLGISGTPMPAKGNDGGSGGGKKTPVSSRNTALVPVLVAQAAVHEQAPTMEFSLLTDSEGSVLAASCPAWTGSGKAGEMIGRPVWDVIPGADQEDAHMLVDVARSTGRPVSFSHEQGEFRYAGGVYPVQDPWRNLVNLAVWGHKIPLVQDMAEERSSRDRHLMEAQRLEAVSTLAAGIAEDICRVLWSVVESAQVVESMELSEEHPVRPSLLNLLDSAHHARHLAAKILSFAGREASSREPVELRRLVEETLFSMRPGLPKGIQAHLYLGPGSLEIMADAVQIERVLFHLFANSVESMRNEGGALEIGLFREDLTSADASRLPGLRPGSYARITIKDTGKGISQETLQWIFEPCFAAQCPETGEGLGLAVAQSIIAAHGGGMSVESEPGLGTSFHVYLPLPGGETGFVVNNEFRVSLPGGSEQILFVDDQPALRDFGKTLLDRLGYQVTAVESAEKALEVFLQNPKRYSLVITDQNMEIMTGLELTDQILSVRPDIPVILCTANSSLVSRENAQAVGLARLMSKPVGAKTLAETVREVLDERE
ncbi:MAG: response regulator [Proteobacteria bacterium]|nr:response regulator [Pseudomonadota bacterium]